MDRSIDLAVKRMFGPLIIDEGPSLSTTAGRAVAQLMLVWLYLSWNLHQSHLFGLNKLSERQTDNRTQRSDPRYPGAMKMGKCA